MPVFSIHDQNTEENILASTLRQMPETDRAREIFRPNGPLHQENTVLYSPDAINEQKLIKNRTNSLGSFQSFLRLG